MNEDDFEISPIMNEDTIVSGIVCRDCGNTLPAHTMRVHLNPTNAIHTCPHVVDA